MNRWGLVLIFGGLVACGELTAETDTFQERGEAPAYIATMTHLEGDWSYSEGEGGDLRFQWDNNKIRDAMTLFEQEGGVMTVESEVPFATKELEMNEGIFDELLARGMGVGTHCDISSRLDISAEEMAEEFRLRKAPMDQLVGAENNLGCSGGASESDWATAASMAGFKYLNGLVSFHYLSMPVEARPGPIWTDEYIYNGHNHEPAPQDLSHRVHPFMMANANDFEPDENGVILANPGELGRLASFYERSQGKTCSTACPLTEEDVELAIAALEEGLGVRDASRVLKMDVYLPLSEFTDEKMPMVAKFIQRVNEEFVDTGRLEWATQAEVYEGYVEWNE